MIVARTPLRISFLGGGTDYPDHYRLHGGETFTMAVRQYTTVVVSRLTRFVDYRLRIHYSTVETVQEIDQIAHPSARESLRFMGFEEGIEVHYINDLPARTGLGSSSSATVGLLQALHALRGEAPSGTQLAEEAVHVEQNCIRERVGAQDQYICALGGFRNLCFSKDGTVDARAVAIPRDRWLELEQSLLLLYTGRQRTAHEVLHEQMERTRAGKNLVLLQRLAELARRGTEALASDEPLATFGELLHEGWMCKRRLSTRVSDDEIDRLYYRGRSAGALGGKLLGAGGGGFLLFFAAPAKRQAVREALGELEEAAVGLDQEGSRIVFNDETERTRPQPREVRRMAAHAG